MQITAISDLHGHTPNLPPGDLLIIAGDHTDSDAETQWAAYIDWLATLPYDKVILIAGNHDNWLRDNAADINWPHNVEYLQDSGTTYKNHTIWGSPWTTRFFGQNHAAMAFTDAEDAYLRNKWDLIPDNTDILITHSPPLSILDGEITHWGQKHYGSASLRHAIERLDNLKLHIFGHIHGGAGIYTPKDKYDDNTTYINAAIMNDVYDPVNQPVTLTLQST